MTVHEAVALSFARWVAAYPSIALEESTIDVYARSLADVDPRAIVAAFDELLKERKNKELPAIGLVRERAIARERAYVPTLTGEGIRAYYPAPKSERERARLERLLREWQATYTITAETPYVLHDRWGGEYRHTPEEEHTMLTARAHIDALRAALGE